jgi:hypothetical protein
MKFLIKKEWEKILSQLSFNKNSTKEAPAEKIFFEISQRIKNITRIYPCDHNTYGIAMTLFHYYICFNNIRNLDTIEICFACFYMASKIQFRNISLKDLTSKYKNYIKENNAPEKEKNPDFIKYEIQLYSQLGYDLDIETPYQFFYNYFYYKYPHNTKEEIEKMTKIKNFCFNLINDTYTRPLSIYYHPKIIYLSCIILSLKFLEYNEFEINELIKNEKIDLIVECMEKIYGIYYRFIEDNSNINNNINNSNNDNQKNNSGIKEINNNNIINEKKNENK